MIVVTMQLRSAISRDRDARLVTIGIVNDGTGTTRKGNYDYVVNGKTGRLLRAGRIEGWPRQSKTPLALLQAVVNAAYPPTKQAQGRREKPTGRQQALSLVIDKG